MSTAASNRFSSMQGPSQQWDSDDDSDEDDAKGRSGGRSAGSLDWGSEEVRHAAFIQTSLNLSEVLSVLFTFSGLDFHRSKLLVKCGEHHKTQIRRQFEQLHALGFYDDIDKHLHPNGAICESMPTAASGTNKPDGNLRAARCAGLFRPGGVFHGRLVSYFPCVNFDTGLTEPSRHEVYNETIYGEPMFKTAFKRGPDAFVVKCEVSRRTTRHAMGQLAQYMSSVKHGGRIGYASSITESITDRQWNGMVLGAGKENENGEGSKTEKPETPEERTQRLEKERIRREEFIRQKTEYYANFLWPAQIITEHLEVLLETAMAEFNTYDRRMQVCLMIDKLWSDIDNMLESRVFDMNDSSNLYDVGNVATVLAYQTPRNFDEFIQYLMQMPDVPEVNHVITNKAIALIFLLDRFKDGNLNISTLRATLLLFQRNLRDLAGKDRTYVPEEVEMQQNSSTGMVFVDQETKYFGWQMGGVGESVLKSMIVLPAPKNPMADSFFGSFKLAFDFFSRSGRDLRGLYISKHMQRLVREDSWADERERIVKVFNQESRRPLLYQAYFFNGYKSLNDESTTVRIEIEELDEYLEKFKNINSFIIQPFLQLIADRFNVEIVIVDAVLNRDKKDEVNFYKGDELDGTVNVRLIVSPSPNRNIFEGTDAEYEARKDKYFFQVMLSYREEKYEALGNNEFRKFYKDVGSETVMQKNLVKMLQKAKESSLITRMQVSPEAATMEGSIQLNFTAELVVKICRDYFEVLGWDLAQTVDSVQLFYKYFMEKATPSTAAERALFNKIMVFKTQLQDAQGFDRFDCAEAVYGDIISISGVFNCTAALNNYYKIMKAHRAKKELSDIDPRPNPLLFSVFDFVHLPRVKNALLAQSNPRVVDSVFEVFHLGNTHKDGSANAHLYVRCIWFSMMSLVFQKHLPIRAEFESDMRNQESCILRTFARLDSSNDMVEYIKSACSSSRYRDNDFAQELIRLFETDNEGKFDTKHKELIASILNLRIFELTMDENLGLNPDMSAFEVNYLRRIYGTDTFYLNSGVVLNTLSISEDPPPIQPMLLIHQDYNLTLKTSDVKKVSVSEFDFLEDYFFALDKPCDFFECVSKVFQGDVAQDTGSEHQDKGTGAEPLTSKMLFETGDEAKVAFVDLLCKMFCWYTQGYSCLDETVDATQNKDVLIKVNASFQKIRLVIEHIIEFHWMNMVVNDYIDVSKFKYSEYSIGTWVTRYMWRAFLMYTRSNEYIPSPYEIQVFSDYYQINICGFELVSDETLPVYQTEITKYQRHLDWVFMPRASTSKVWPLVYDNENKQFCIMREKSILPDSRIIVLHKVSKLDTRNITHLQQAIEDKKDYLEEAYVILNTPMNFYRALDVYLSKRGKIPYMNVFSYRKDLTKQDLDDIIIVFHKHMYDTYEAVKDLLIAEFPEVSTHFDAVLLSAIKTLQEMPKVARNDVYTLLNNAVAEVSKGLLAQFHKGWTKNTTKKNTTKMFNPTQNREEFVQFDVILRNKFLPIAYTSKTYEKIDDIIHRIHTDKKHHTPPPLDYKYHDWPEIKNVIKEGFKSLSDSKQANILKYHYGPFKSEIQLSKEEFKKKEKDYYDDKWDLFCTKEDFLNKLPSMFELQEIPHILKMRMQIFYSSWYKAADKRFYELGALNEFLDAGPNSNIIIPFVFDNYTMTVMEYDSVMPKRAGLQEKIASPAKWAKFLGEIVHTKGFKELYQGKLPADLDKGKDLRDNYIYKFIGCEPGAGVEDVCKLLPKQFKDGWRMFHTNDDARVEGGGKFMARLGPNGPQTYEEVLQLREIADQFGLKANEMVNLSWQIFTNSRWRAIYHFKGNYPPKSEWNSSFKPNMDDVVKQSQNLGAAYKDYGISMQPNINWTSKSGSTIMPMNVFILVKTRYPQDLHKLRKSKDDKDQLQRELDLGTRDLAIDQFNERYVGSFGSSSTFQQTRKENFAAMIPVRKADSRIKLRDGDFKVYDMRDSKGNLEYGMVKIMRIRGPEAYTDFITSHLRTTDVMANNVWANEWCGLRMCIQCALFVARTSEFKKMYSTLPGYTSMKWLSTFYAESDRNYKFRDGTNINFKGITNPYHITYATLSDLLNLVNDMLKHELQSNDKYGNEYFYKQTFKKIYARFYPEGMPEIDWSTERKFNAYFDTCFDEDEKKKKSLELMLVIGAIFNLDFKILNFFPEHDVNSLHIKEKLVYYNVTSTRGARQATPVYNLDDVCLNYYGEIYWSEESVNMSEYIMLRTRRTQAPRLMVYVIWKDQRWQFMHWIQYVNLIFEQQQKAEIAKRRRELAQKSRPAPKPLPSYFKGPLGPNDAPKQPKTPDSPEPPAFGASHFESNNCGQRDKSGRDRGDSDSDDGDSDGDDGNWDDGDDWGDGNHRGGRWNDDEDGDDRRQMGGRDGYDNAYDGDYDRKARAWTGAINKAQATIRNEDKSRREAAAQQSRGSKKAWGAQASFQLPKRPRLGAAWLGCCSDAPVQAVAAAAINEDQKELHFLCQRIGEVVNVLGFLLPHGSYVAKLQIGQTEQSKMLGVILACCFDQATFLAVKGCFTSRIAMAAKGYRSSMVRAHGLIHLLRECFDMKVHSFRRVVNYIRDNRMVPPERLDALEEEMERASDDLWAEDFRCAVILCRACIQGTLEGQVRPAPEYLSRGLAKLLNMQVFSRVSQEDRNKNKEMIRQLMSSSMAGQLLPLFRVVVHPDLHVWRKALPRKERRMNEGEREHWDWTADFVRELPAPKRL